jgi:hypothetical protein
MVLAIGLLVALCIAVGFAMLFAPGSRHARVAHPDSPAVASSLAVDSSNRPVVTLSSQLS